MTDNEQDKKELADTIIDLIDKSEEQKEANNEDVFKIVTDIDKLHIKGEKVEKSNIKDAYICKKRIVSYLKSNTDALGLAAQQLGFNLRMFGIRDNNGEIIIFINPILNLIKPTKYTRTVKEQCLSLPGETYEIKRCLAVKVKYQDSDLRWQEKTFRDFRAVVVQHENDHINGIIISDNGKKVFSDDRTLNI